MCDTLLHLLYGRAGFSFFPPRPTTLTPSLPSLSLQHRFETRQTVGCAYLPTRNILAVYSLEDDKANAFISRETRNSTRDTLPSIEIAVSMVDNMMCPRSRLLCKVPAVDQKYQQKNRCILEIAAPVVNCVQKMHPKKIKKKKRNDRPVRRTTGGTETRIDDYPPRARISSPFSRPPAKSTAGCGGVAIPTMAEQGGRYTPSVYLSVTDDANRWREGPPQPKQLTNQSKVS